MAKLAVSTIVPAPPAAGGEPFRVFGPDDDVPEWAARQIGAHCFEGGKHPYAEPAGESAPEPAGDRKPGEEPPRNGPGRDEIIELMVNAELIKAEQ